MNTEYNTYLECFDFETMIINNQPKAVAFSHHTLGLLHNKSDFKYKSLINEPGINKWFEYNPKGITKQFISHLYNLTKLNYKRFGLIFINSKGFDNFFIRDMLLQSNFQYTHKKLKNKQFREIIVNGRILQTEIRIGNKYIVTQDLLNYFQGSLASLARNFNVENKVNTDEIIKKHNLNNIMEFYNLKNQPENPNPELFEDYKKYTLQDTRTLALILDKIYTQNKMNIMGRITSSGYAEQQVEKFLGKADFKKFTRLENTLLNMQLWEWINKSYYGGWTYAEPTAINKVIKNMFSIDANSMYPFQMLFDLPYGQPYDTKPNGSYATLHRVIFKDLTLKDNHIPIIRKPNPKTGEMKFETKITEPMEYTIWDFELEQVKYQYHYNPDSITIIETKYFKTRPFLKQLIERLYSERQFHKARKEDPFHLSEDLRIKLILNSIYGKFGQKITNPIYVMIEETPEIMKQLKETRTITIDNINYNIESIPTIRYEFNNKKHLHLKLNYISEYDKQTNAAKQFKNVAIASYITAKARNMLFKAINLIKSEGAYFVYSDTDSIKFQATKAQWERIKNQLDMTPNKLGAWDLELEGGEILVKQAKQYAVKDKNKIKITSASYNDIKLETDDLEDLLTNKIELRKQSAVKTATGVIINEPTINLNYFLAKNKKGYIIKEQYIENGNLIQIYEGDK